MKELLRSGSGACGAPERWSEIARAASGRTLDALKVEFGTSWLTHQFQSFVRALAARSGQLLNLSDVSGDLGIAVNTATAWLSVLEASYQVVVVQPWFANTGKRLARPRRSTSRTPARSVS